MDTARLAAIRAREQAATPGPWVAWHDPEISAYLDPIWQWRVAQDDTRIQGTVLIIKAAWNEADAAFIAAARADVPDLLTEIERLRAGLARLRRRDHVRADDGTWAVCQYECQCGADEQNARIAALLSGGNE